MYNFLEYEKLVFHKIPQKPSPEICTLKGCPSTVSFTQEPKTAYSCVLKQKDRLVYHKKGSLRYLVEILIFITSYICKFL